ncbi:hypothetical protein VEE11_00910 [Escherichia coli]|nr:hypothetical protein VEE11_00910 [Escherichia coli]
MAENRVEANAHNAGGCPASNAIHGHINDFLVRTGLRSGVSELQLPCFTAMRAEIALMSGSAFAVTHYAFSSGAGRTSDGNGSHASTLKSPSYTKSVSWQHYLISVPFSKKGRLVGFCKDINLGYCSCHTVAFAAIQIAYSLKYARIICSGLDLTGSCSRFYDEDKNPMPSELTRDLFKILPFFRFMRENIEDINIYNLSDDTAIQYDIIPYMKISEIEEPCVYEKIS